MYTILITGLLVWALHIPFIALSHFILNDSKKQPGVNVQLSTIFAIISGVYTIKKTMDSSSELFTDSIWIFLAVYGIPVLLFNICITFDVMARIMYDFKVLTCAVNDKNSTLGNMSLKRVRYRLFTQGIMWAISGFVFSYFLNTIMNG